jgi:hypothetical protein
VKEDNRVCKTLLEKFNHSFLDALVQQQPVSSNNVPVKVNETAPVPEEMIVETTNEQAKTAEVITENRLTINNPCVLCGKEEKRLACIPCGHLASCVNCSNTLRTCPVCRREIQAFVRIYL